MPHITASVFINDAEDSLLHDYDVWLEKLAPYAPTSQYQHNRTGEDNADAHIKRQIMGREVVRADDVVKVNLQDGCYAQQRVQTGIPDLALNKTDHCLGQSGTLRELIHRKPLLLPFLSQYAGDVAADGQTSALARLFP